MKHLLISLILSSLLTINPLNTTSNVIKKGSYDVKDINAVSGYYFKFENISDKDMKITIYRNNSTITYSYLIDNLDYVITEMKNGDKLEVIGDGEIYVSPVN